MAAITFDIGKTTENISQLNRRGQEGWEAIGIVRNGWILMKREIPSPQATASPSGNVKIVARIIDPSNFEDGEAD